MEAQTILRTNLSLFVGTGFAHIGAQVTDLVIFSWIALMLAVWLALDVYWLCICYLYHRLPSPEKKQDNRSLPVKSYTHQLKTDLDPRSHGLKRHSNGHQNKDDRIWN